MSVKPYMFRRLSGLPSLLLVSLLLAACDRLREVSETLLDHRTPRERYVASLESAGLTATALARDWTLAGERSLREAPLVSSPFAEEGYFAPAEPAAIAYRVAVRRGQEVSFGVELPDDTASLLFVDAWLVEHDSVTSYRRIADADSGRRLITVEPRRDGEILFRAQPELLRGGRFRVNLRLTPTLAFPVGSGRERDIGSRYGAPRDGGRRDHHGIDIFAPRGTPAVAASEALVTRVETTPRGGNVVWLRDVRGNRLYYAHLDRQRVVQGMRVLPGDTVGFVGNTGNARTTPPHLHFGVYRRGEGPVDPYWFVYRPRGDVPRLLADTARLGDWARTPNDRVLLRAAPDDAAQRVMALPRHTPLRVIAAVGNWYRVRLPDGLTGYVSARLIESAERAVAVERPERRLPLLARPVDTHAPHDVIAEVSPGDAVRVLGRFGTFLLVRGPSGASGWVEQGQ
ncbi:MAG TPA: peptidoglycan DD-metalloendopeptidase family protein [Gemmatimonadaceae bacterium]|nr:peptidoglycan DD-metalloendopeptidase family protein [Gemmatimonadaceae bacterium]